MNNITISQELKNLIPQLSAEEYAQLEQNIISDGCRDPLVLWNGTLVDGHNRYEICTRYDVEFKTVEMYFAGMDQAKEWIILNQFGRRNLPAYERAKLALKLKPVIAEKAKEQQIRKPLNFVPQTFVEQMETNKELAKISGVSHETIRKVEKIEENAPEELKQKCRTGEVSINQAYKEIRQTERRAEVSKTLKTMELPTGKYDVIYCDPPWKYDFAISENRAIENNYPTMTIEELEELNIPAADNSVILMWATAPKLTEAVRLMQSWGYDYKTNAVWDKEVIGMGYWFRGQHEFLMVGVKGKFPPPDPDNRFSSVIREKRQGHSKKPDLVYEMIEQMFPSRKYIELFSRNKHSEKWEVWGNQI